MGDRIEKWRAKLEFEALDAGEKGGEAFARTKYRIAEFWLCWEFRAQRLHDDFCKQFDIDKKCPHSAFRTFISRQRTEWRDNYWQPMSDGKDFIQREIEPPKEE